GAVDYLAIEGDGDEPGLEVDGEPCAVWIVPRPHILHHLHIRRAGVHSAEVFDGVVADFSCKRHLVGVGGIFLKLQRLSYRRLAHA
ncbi:MAG: hypothetical protein J6T70_12670, partial [Bacteroidales bacterium]|nr:hypothetical protein [Bacteroidales bacterium]